MSQSERNQDTVKGPFSLTVDQYGRLWLHAKLQGHQVSIYLAEKERAFQIIATTMTELHSTMAALARSMVAKRTTTTSCGDSPAAP